MLKCFIIISENSYITFLIKRDGGIGPMKSQQPAQQYGANSNWQNFKPER